MASQNAVNAGVAVQPNTRQIIPALFQKKFITSQQLQKQVSFDLFKAGLSNEFLKAMWLHVTGTMKTGSATKGAAVTSTLNPYDILTNCSFNVSPTPGAGLLPFNQVTGRGLYTVEAIDRREFMSQLAQFGGIATALSDPETGNVVNFADGNGNYTIDFWIPLRFQRNHVRKPAEYGFPLSKFTSAVLALSFDLSQTLFSTGSANTWDYTGLTAELWGDWDYDSAPAGVHATELYEQSFPVTANGPFLINQLPAGVIYTDIHLLVEHNGQPVSGVIDNIDIEGGGRNWTFNGDGNANYLAKITRAQFDGSVNAANAVLSNGGYGDLSGVPGLFMFPMRGGSFLRGLDARNTQLLIKPNVTGWTNSGTYNIRLLARKITPYGIVAHAGGSQTGVPKGKR